MQKVQTSAARHIKRYQGVAGASELYQPRVATNPEIFQLRFVVHFKGARQLVIAAPQRPQVHHVVHAGQLGDGTVLTVQIGQRFTISQASDCLKIIIVVAPQIVQCRAASHFECRQVLAVAVEFGQLLVASDLQVFRLPLWLV